MMNLSLQSAYQFFMVFRFGVFFLISLLIARLVPNKAQIAEYETLTFLTASLSFFWITGLFSGFLTLFKGADAQQRANLLGETISLSTLFSLGSLILVFLIKMIWYPEISIGFSLAFSLYFLFYSLSHPAEYYLAGAEKPKMLALWALIPFGFHFLSMAIPLFLGMDLEMALWSAAAMAFLKWLSQFFLPGFSGFKIFPDPTLRKKIFRFSLPIAGSALVAGTSAGYLDSFLVSRNFSAADFVNFQYGAKELPVVLMFANALGSLASANLYANSHQPAAALAELKQKTIRLLHVFGWMSVLLLILSSPLFKAVYGVDFEGASRIFDIYLLLLIPRLAFPQSILKGFLKTGPMFRISLLELLLNFSISVILMQFWGMAGVAVGTVIAYSFERVLLFRTSKRLTGISSAEFHPWGWHVFYSLLLISAWLVKNLFFS